MSALYDEMLQRFPELRSWSFESDKELPYLLMGHLAEWAESMAAAGTSTHIPRLQDFSEWCLAHPRGKDARDDIVTIFTVGFYEKLFESDLLRPLIPHLVKRSDVINNAEYLRAWVGGDNYEKALRCFDRSPPRKLRRGKQAGGRRR